MTKANMDKVMWLGRVVAVQPRIRLMRPFDEQHHSYKGTLYTEEDWVDEDATSHRGLDNIKKD